MSNLTHLRYLLEDARSHYYFSGYQFVAESPAGKIRLYGGATSYWPDAIPVSADTYFDIGSVTKVVATTSILARLFDKKSIQLQLDDKVEKFLPKFQNTRLGECSLAALLSHSAGLSAWEPFFRQKRNLTDWLLSESDSLIRYQNECHYSDIGFMLLGLVLDSKAPLQTLFENEVRSPLGLICSFQSQKEQAAATEFCLWRNRLLQGEVFDENCAAMGGVGAHAGLFASAEGIVPLARAWLSAWKGEQKWLLPATARLFTTRTNFCPGSTFAYGWDTKSETNSSAGDYFSKESFGHLGFPGCSLWIDPVAEGFVIFLTNRIHPSRADDRIRKLRPIIHNEVAQIWRSSGGY